MLNILSHKRPLIGVIKDGNSVHDFLGANELLKILGEKSKIKAINLDSKYIYILAQNISSEKVTSVIYIIDKKNERNTATV